jgi:hypothetical protein
MRESKIFKSLQTEVIISYKLVKYIRRNERNTSIILRYGGIDTNIYEVNENNEIGKYVILEIITMYMFKGVLETG